MKKISPTLILTAVTLSMAGVLAVTSELPGIRHFTRSTNQTVTVIPHPPAAVPPAAPAEPLYILGATYSFGSQSADVTHRVRELISKNGVLWANPDNLHADPHPYMNKALVVFYEVQGERAVLSVGENERVDRARLLKNAAHSADQVVAQTRADR